MRHTENTHKAKLELDNLLHTLPGLSDELREELFTVAYRLGYAMLQDYKSYQAEGFDHFVGRSFGKMIGVTVEREEWEKASIAPYFVVQAKEADAPIHRPDNSSYTLKKRQVALVRSATMEEDPNAYYTKNGEAIAVDTVTKDIQYS